MFQLNPYLRAFWDTPARNKVLHGGRASSKSHDAAGRAVFLSSNYTLKIMCARRFQARISESVYALVKAKIEESPFYKDWKILNTSMVNKKTGSEFLFFGIERNLAEIKSTEDVDILWLEEANYITEEHWKILEPTIRAETSEIWMVFNPDLITDFIYDRFVTEWQPSTIVQQINWTNNPWIVGLKGANGEWIIRPNMTMLNIILHEYEVDRDRAEHIYGGKVRTGGDLSIINYDYILAAIDAHKKVPGWDNTGQRRLGFDIADDGDDLCATAYAEGNILMEVDEWFGLEDELLKSATRVWIKARDTNSHITFDSIGVGASAGAKFKELNDQHPEFEAEYFGFNAGGGVDRPDDVYMRLPHTKILNKEHFENVKAQKWTEVAEKFRKTYEVVRHGANHPIEQLVSINSETISPKLLKQLMKELSVVRKDISGRGKFMAEPKDKLRDRGIKSPNVADAIIMALMKPIAPPKGFWD